MIRFRKSEQFGFASRPSFNSFRWAQQHYEPPKFKPLIPPTGITGKVEISKKMETGSRTPGRLGLVAMKVCYLLRLLGF